jgi:hypothetical protein
VDISASYDIICRLMQTDDDDDFPQKNRMFLMFLQTFL